VLLAQPLGFTPLPLPLALEPLDLRSQPRDLFGLLFGEVAGGVRPLGDATVMPELSIQYKSNRSETR
jgi:hypothetical protein